MKWIRAFLFRLAGFVRRSRQESEMNAEIEAHLEGLLERKVAAGMAVEEARYAVRREFGGIEQVKEQCRDQRYWSELNRLLADFVYSVRRARKSPSFTLISIATLATCLTTNLITFSVIDSILLRSLAYPEADRLLTLYDSYLKGGLERNGSSLTSYYERRGNIPAFASLSAYRLDQADAGASGSTERADVLRVSPEFFATLGVSLEAGRSFDEKETRYETDDVIIITDHYWRLHFDGNQLPIGRDVRIDGSLKRIIGVLPPGFQFLSYRTDYFLPLSSNASERAIQYRHHSGGIETFARLRPGATIQEARMQIRSHYLAHAAEFPFAKLVEQMGFHTVIVAMRDDYVASIRSILIYIQWGGLCLLVIGIVNFSNLLLIRAGSRTKEIAVRRAIGATRWMVVSDALIDTTLLTGTAGLIAICVGSGVIYAVSHFASNILPLHADIAIDARLASLAIFVSLLLGVLLALPIAYLHLHEDTAKALQSISRGGGVSSATNRIRYSSIIAQIALAFVLLSSAGLLNVSLERAANVAPGFSPDKVLTAEISLLGSHYNDEKERSEFATLLLNRIAETPGVIASAVTNNVPMSGKKSYNGIAVDGIPPGRDPEGILHYTYFIAGDYFKAMSIPLKEGRLIQHGDGDHGLFDCVVDENFANRYWPKSSALGHRIYYGPAVAQNEAYTIVGVVGAVKQTSLTNDHENGAVYFRYERISDKSIYLVLKSLIPDDQLGTSLTKWVRAIDPEIPVADVRTMETRLTDSVGSRRWPAILTSIFAALGLFLTSIGVYGVVSYAVEQRRREIGIRLALGASRAQICFQFISLGLTLLFFGTIIGLVCSWAIGKSIQSFLFSVPVLHAATLLTTAGMMTVLLLVASWWPARRGSSINPAEVLAEE